jgi:hypothetical protein
MIAYYGICSLDCLQNQLQEAENDTYAPKKQDQPECIPVFHVTSVTPDRGDSVCLLFLDKILKTRPSACEDWKVNALTKCLFEFLVGADLFESFISAQSV